MASGKTVVPQLAVGRRSSAVAPVRAAFAEAVPLCARERVQEARDMYRKGFCTAVRQVLRTAASAAGICASHGHLQAAAALCKAAFQQLPLQRLVMPRIIIEVPLFQESVAAGH